MCQGTKKGHMAIYDLQTMGFVCFHYGQLLKVHIYGKEGGEEKDEEKMKSRKKIKRTSRSKHAQNLRSMRMVEEPRPIGLLRRNGTLATLGENGSRL